MRGSIQYLTIVSSLMSRMRGRKQLPSFAVVELELSPCSMSDASGCLEWESRGGETRGLGFWRLVTAVAFLYSLNFAGI